MAVSPQPALYPTGSDAATSAAIALLIHYFNLSPASAQLLVKKWLTNYPAIWVRAAVTEALYQGRYKPYSVEQILAFWQRRGKLIAHFNKEFETIIAVPLEGSFKTETDVAIEGNSSPALGAVANDRPESNGSAVAEPALAPNTTLALALEAAEREQTENDEPLPRPRLMLPGELPGKGLAQRIGPTTPQTPPTEAPAPAKAPATKDSPARSSSEAEASSDSQAANSQAPESQAPDPQAAISLPKPTGFDGIIDPRPRPQVTQGPDSALVAESKSNLQPPPIGPFTPAADPSGFASRLKSVVEQAIAKTQTEAEQLSLETAIASQLAKDPVLGQPSSDDEAADDVTANDSSALTEESAATDRPETPVVQDGAEADGPTATSLDSAAIQDSVSPLEAVEVTATEEQPAAERLSDSEMQMQAALAQAIQGSEVEATASKLAPSEADPSEAMPEPLSMTLASGEAEASTPETPEQDATSQDSSQASTSLEKAAAEIDQTSPSAAFEERFPLTATNNISSNSPKDELDIALDSHALDTQLKQTFLDEEEPDDSLTPADNDRLNQVFDAKPEIKIEANPRDRLKESIEADEAALYALGTGQLLDDEALSRHLDAEESLDSELMEPELDANSSQEQSPNITEASDTNPIAMSLDSTDTEELPSSEIPSSDTPNLIPTEPPQATPLSETTLEISQVSNLMAGLTQPKLSEGNEGSSLLSDLDLTAAEASSGIEAPEVAETHDESRPPADN